MKSADTDTDSRPFVPVEIHGRTFYALLDTGAMSTVIGRIVARHLRTRGVSARSSDVRIRLADGARADVTECYEIEGQIGNLGFMCEAAHVPSLSCDIILGMDVIEELQLVDFKTTVCDKHGSTRNRGQARQIEAMTKLTASETSRLEDFLGEEMAQFEQTPGRTDLIEHNIRLKKGTVPIKQRYYPRNPAMQEIINSAVDEMLADGVIEPSSSAWSSPVVMIKKPSGNFRFCIDFRELNKCTEKDAYPLPQINPILEKLRGAKYISTIDLRHGYWQVPLSVESRPLTAFTVPGKGLYQFTVMPFGLHSAGATFQRLLDKIIGPALEPEAFAYLDDLVLVSSSFSDHLRLLKEVFNRLRSAGLVVNKEKCHFCKTELKYLGHVVNEHGIQTDPDKVRAINEFPRPHNVRTLRGFLGMASWYRRFVESFAKLSAPLTKLLRKDAKWAWGEEQEAAFELLKSRLTSAPILACPDFTKKFVVQVDASGTGLGASLTQVQNGKEVVIAFASRLLGDNERRYTVSEQECLALVWSLKKFRPYLEGYRFVAITDHQALKWLLQLKEPSGRLARWILELQQYDFEIRYRKGTLNKVADALSRNCTREAEEVDACPVNIIPGDERSSVNAQAAKDTPALSENPPTWYQNDLQKVREHPERWPDLLERDGHLYRRFRRDRIRKPTDTSPEWKLCIPPDMVSTVLEEVHDRATAGHLGRKKTLRRVATSYFWPGWRKDVIRHVQKCTTCQKYKVEQKKPYGKMYFRRPLGPWHTITSDLIGPLPRSKSGASFLLVFQDNYSKWTELAALRAATAKAVSDQFRRLILMRFGAPSLMIVDNGVQYVADLFTRVAREWEVEVRYTPPYSPQCNPTERQNRVLKTMIAQYVESDHRTWDVNLPEFAFAVNTAVHESTKFTPAALNFGRELRVPKTVARPEFETSETEDAPVREDLHENRTNKYRAMFEECQRNMQAAHVQQAKHYNLRRRDVPFKIGQLVWRRTHPLSSAAAHFAGKLAPKFTGPCKIVSRRGINVFEVVDQGTKRKVVVHAKDLKPYFDGSAEATN